MPIARGIKIMKRNFGKQWNSCDKTPTIGKQEKIN
jgi:hypothetical protein